MLVSLRCISTNMLNRARMLAGHKCINMKPFLINKVDTYINNVETYS